tara:strand:- start:554 stop:862 length:309 start_codon:yes stop_codon:yes gene_type:complete
LIYGILAIVFNISYIAIIDKNNVVLFDSVFADWSNSDLENQAKYNVGSSNSMAFNEIIVLDANLTQTTTTKDGKKQSSVINKCPTYEEYNKEKFSKMRAYDK